LTSNVCKKLPFNVVKNPKTFLLSQVQYLNDERKLNETDMMKYSKPFEGLTCRLVIHTFEGLFGSQAVMKQIRKHPPQETNMSH